jgi:hypothetical protein
MDSQPAPAVFIKTGLVRIETPAERLLKRFKNGVFDILIM